jgi:ZIP family zinc transporter
MARAVVYALIASSALVIGGAVGAWRPVSARVTSALLAFASGALITAVAFDLFEEAFGRGGAVRTGIAFAAGATVFVLIDSWLDRRTEARRSSGANIGFALLAGVTLDGVPENLAMGVSLIGSASPTLLVAIFASNLPEALVGARRMADAGLSRGRVLVIWSATALLLAAAVVAGRALLGDVDPETLAWPLGFAAGAVLASLADTLMPEAFEEGGPTVAYATALGFLLSYLVSAA